MVNWRSWYFGSSRDSERLFKVARESRIECRAARAAASRTNGRRRDSGNWMRPLPSRVAIMARMARRGWKSMARSDPRTRSMPRRSRRRCDGDGKVEKRPGRDQDGFGLLQKVERGEAVEFGGPVIFLSVRPDGGGGEDFGKRRDSGWPRVRAGAAAGCDCAGMSSVWLEGSSRQAMVAFGEPARGYRRGAAR